MLFRSPESVLNIISVELNCTDLSVRLVSRYDVSGCRTVNVSGVKLANMRNKFYLLREPAVVYD